jgi:hypothetical protein
MFTLIFIVSMLGEPKVGSIPNLTEEECAAYAYVLVSEQGVYADCQYSNGDV